MSTLGVLVAGGRGSRLALGMPKALVPLGGVTLLARALATLGAVCDRIVVSAPRSMSLPLPEAVAPGGRSCPVRRVHDPDGAVGPLAGMVAGLGELPFDRAIVLGTDLPLMEPACLEALALRLPGRHAVVPAAGGFLQPLAAAYAAAAGPILAACLAAGERSPTRALGSLDVLRLDDRELARLPGGAACFFNLNTPADLDQAERRMAARETSR